MPKKRERKVFLENLPKEPNGKRIDWRKCVGLEVKFIYEEINDIVKIIGRNEVNKKLIIIYKNKEYEIHPTSLINCNLGAVVSKVTSDYKFEIGQVLKDEKRDLTIIDRKYDKIKSTNSKWYRYRCNKCGFDSGKHCNEGEYKEEYWIVESSLVRGIGCTCCCPNPKIVVPHINSILAREPWMMKLGVSEEDAKTHTPNSGKKIEVICPDCGEHKIITTSRIYTDSSISCACGDGYSYPEKFMMNVLEQLGIKYQTQYTDEWTDGKRYDFYLLDYNIIVETHGIQHYKDVGFKRSLEEEQENDRLKKELALTSNIDKYVVIDCRESDMKWIKSSIENSELSKLFDLSGLDWIQADKSGLSNRIKEICKLWQNSNGTETTTTLGERFQIDRHTVNIYLKKGAEYGWCSYKPSSTVKVEVLLNGISIRIFDSIAQLERESLELFGMEFTRSIISGRMKGITKTPYNGYMFRPYEDV